MRLANAQSTDEGDGSPEGWLCTKMMPAALTNTAALNTSLGYIGVESIEPRLTSWYPIRSIFVVRHRTYPTSHVSGSSSGLITAAAALAVLMFTGPFSA